MNEKENAITMTIDETAKRIEELSVKRTKDTAEWLSTLEEIEELSLKLASKGKIDSNRECFFDVKTCKYVTLDTKAVRLDYVTSSTKTFQLVAKSFYRDNRVHSSFADFVPSKSVIFNPRRERAYRTTSNEQVINIWRESDYMKIEPNRLKDSIGWDAYPTIHSLFENVFHVYKDSFVNWLAYAVQYRKKSTIAWVSKGEKGTGKGIIYDNIITPLFQGYTREIGNDEIEDKFNDWQDNKLFLLANEISIDYNNATKTGNSIKRYITSNLIKSESKGIRSKEIETFYNMWFHTNEKNPFIVERGDRRLTIVETKGKIEDNIEGFEYVPFINSLNEELHDFLMDLSMLKVDVVKACTPIETVEKEEAVVMNQTSMEFLKASVEDNKYEDLEEILEQIVDDKEIYLADVSNVLKHLCLGYLTITDKHILHHAVTGKKASTRKVGLDFTIAFGQNERIKTPNGRIRVTTFKAMYPIEFED